MPSRLEVGDTADRRSALHQAISLTEDTCPSILHTALTDHWLTNILPAMSTQVIFPRSPRETMDGWVYLPRFLDKIRLHLAGKLHPDYQENFTKGFDGSWLQAAGVKPEEFIEVVKSTVCDGQVCDWVRTHVKKSAAEKAAFAEFILKRGQDNEEIKARLKWRKEQAGMAHRDEITTFVDYIDADEKRL